jgi:hypothetical protein
VDAPSNTPFADFLKVHGHQVLQTRELLFKKASSEPCLLPLMAKESISEWPVWDQQFKERRLRTRRLILSDKAIRVFEIVQVALLMLHGRVFYQGRFKDEIRHHPGGQRKQVQSDTFGVLMSVPYSNHTDTFA